MKLSIIIPVYNEEQTIGEVIERVWAVDLGDLDREVIIANDGSSDGTQRGDRLEPLDQRSAGEDLRQPDQPRQGRRRPARPRRSPPATSCWCRMPTSSSIPNEYGRLLAPILDGRADIVYGSRFLSADRPRRVAAPPRQPGADDAHQRAVRRPAHRHGNRLQGVQARSARRHPSPLRRLRLRARDHGQGAARPAAGFSKCRSPTSRATRTKARRSGGSTASTRSTRCSNAGCTR